MPTLRLLILRMPTFIALLVAANLAKGQDELDKALVPKPSAEQTVLEAIKSPDLTVVHLWAPWCSNCQAELKSGGWAKIINENPKVKFCFVSVWNDGQGGRTMLNKFNIAYQPNASSLADSGPRRGAIWIYQF